MICIIIIIIIIITSASCKQRGARAARWRKVEFDVSAAWWGQRDDRLDMLDTPDIWSVAGHTAVALHRHFSPTIHRNTSVNEEHCILDLKWD